MCVYVCMCVCLLPDADPAFFTSPKFHCQNDEILAKMRDPSSVSPMARGQRDRGRGSNRGSRGRGSRTSARRGRGSGVSGGQQETGQDVAAMYDLSKNPKQLHQMDIQPGNPNAEYCERSQTVFGAISVACPPLFLEKILSTMNRNLEARNNERIEKETMVQKVVQKLSIVAKCFRGRQVIKPRKGAPNGCGGSPTRRLVLIRNRVRKRFMTRNHHLVRRSRRMVYRKPFSLQELKNFLGLLIFTKQHPAPSLKHYWRRNGDVDHKLPRQMMPRDRFLECLSCFKFTEDYVSGVEKDFRAHMAHIWKSANMGVVDESINPFRGRKNPHHVFIPRKPHPHGLKNWVTVDYSGFCLDCSLFRRGEPPEKTHNTLLRMTEQLSEDSLVVADSYFGSMKSLEGLVERNQHALLACRANRPSGIFKNRLCKNMSEGEVRSE